MLLPRFLPFFLFFVARMNVSGIKLKFDVSIFLDLTPSADENYLEALQDFLKRSMEYLSISPSNTKIFLSTTSQKEPITFLNRECFEEYVDSLRLTWQATDYVSSFSASIFNLLAQQRQEAAGLIFYISSKSRHMFKMYWENYGKERDFLCRQGNIRNIVLVELNRKQEENTDLVKVNTCWLFVQYNAGDGWLRKMLKAIRVPAVSFTKCQKGDGIYDECLRKCSCKNNKLSNCHRIRKEFTSMSKQERRRYISLYKYAAGSMQYRDKFRDLLMIHTVLFKRGIHEKNLFLSWHRWYLWKIENFLREIDCTLTLPYWDWSKESGHPWRVASIWAPGSDGIGGDGDPSRDFCVETGPFREQLWKSVTLATEVKRHRLNKQSLRKLKEFVGNGDMFCLRRSFKDVLQMPTANSIKRTLGLNRTNFTEFELIVRAYYHDFVHCIIGGTMCTDFSADAPEFFLHHGFLDKIWDQWQQKGPEYRYQYFKNASYVMPGSNFMPTDFLDNNHLPGCVAVRYLPPNDKYRKIVSSIGDLWFVKRDDSLQRKREILSAASNLFGTSRDEQAKAQSLINMVESLV